MTGEGVSEVPTLSIILIYITSVISPSVELPTLYTSVSISTGDAVDKYLHYQSSEEQLCHLFARHVALLLIRQFSRLSTARCTIRVVQT